jgi:hypothetical protein
MLFEDSSETDALQKRIADAFSFRISEEIKVRDDEIERLSAKLEWFRNCARLPLPIYSISEHYSIQHRLNELKSKMALEHTKSELRHINRLGEVGSTFHLPLGAQSGLHLENELDAVESQIHKDEERILELRALLKKLRSTSNSEVQPELGEEDSFEQLQALTELSLPELTGDFRAEIQQIKKSHLIEMSELKRKIAEEEKRTKRLNRSIGKLNRLCKSLDTEISESITTERRISEANQNELRKKKETLSIIRQSSEEEKKRLIQSLEMENIVLKREIGRMDFILYGRNGKFAAWRKL